MKPNHRDSIPSPTLVQRVARTLMLGVSLAVVLWATGCSPSEKTAAINPLDPNYIVAETKDFKITRGELDEAEQIRVQREGRSMSQVPASEKPALDKTCIDETILQKTLIKMAEGITIPDLDKQIADTELAYIQKFPSREAYVEALVQHGKNEQQVQMNIRNSILAQAALTAKVPAFEPTEDQISIFYHDNEERFKRPERARYSQVLIKVPENATPEVKAAKKKAIDAARARVMKGEDFGKVAREVSEDVSSAAVGGDVGWTEKGADVEPLVKAVIATKPGKLSAVFETSYGYHFVKTTEYVPAGQTSLEERRPAIASYLRKEGQQLARAQFFAKLLADAGTKYNIPTADYPPKQDATAAANAGPPSRPVSSVAPPRPVLPAAPK